VIKILNKLSMLRFLFFIHLVFLLDNNVSGPPATDSTKHYTLFISPRLNSAGYFPFTGALLNHNVNFDLTVGFEKNNFGFLLFQSFDLQDNKSYINYFQPAVFKKFPIGKSLKIGVYAGYLFSQTNSFSDKGESDYFGALSQHWDIDKKLRLENTILFGELIVQPKLINRLQLIYKLKKIKINFYLHERALFEVKDFSTSAAISIDLPKLRIADKLTAQATITYQHYITKHIPAFALKEGLLFSLAFPIDISK
jgi:hypothetical protein